MIVVDESESRLNTCTMPEYALNLDAPEDTPIAAPFTPTTEYLSVHERDIDMMTSFVFSLFSDDDLHAVCGTDDPWRMEVELTVRAMTLLLERDRYLLDECGGAPERALGRRLRSRRWEPDA